MILTRMSCYLLTSKRAVSKFYKRSLNINKTFYLRKLCFYVLLHYDKTNVFCSHAYVDKLSSLNSTSSGKVHYAMIKNIPLEALAWGVFILEM